MRREFVILPGFEQQWRSCRLTEENLREVEWFLCQHPDFGDIITETGGLRKLRWSAQGRGKRGGVRILVYPKNVKADLTQDEKKVVRILINDLEHELKRK